MYLRSITINNFRNYAELTWMPRRGVNFITGANAQGKTNLIESIFRVAAGRSFRTLKDRELIRWTAPFFRLDSNFVLEAANREIVLNLLITAEGKKQFKHNGILSNIEEAFGMPGAVAFTPEDLMIIKGSPRERRRWLDLDAGSTMPGYLKFLRQYHRVITHRNALLKDIRSKKQPVEALAVWDQQLCLYGSHVISKRLELLAKITPKIRQMYRYLAGGKEELTLTYLSSLKLEKYYVMDDIYNIFYAALEKKKHEEIQRVQTLYGPHRDDIAFFINGSDARHYGSQGQQRTLVLSLKLAQADLCYQEFDEYPLLLLDDVLLELDGRRQHRLMDWVGNRVQVFITTSVDVRQELGETKANIITIRDGHVFEEE